MNLTDEILQANSRAMARAMSLIENQDPQARDILKALFPKTGRASVIGVTGAPGSGKSTLVDKLAQEFRRQGKTVGIVAVDPTSPFSGGAILADRVRMSAHYNDEGVFIRSMATRGHLGGLSKTAAQIVSVLDAAGKDIILLETVGVGQDEVEVVKVADVALVVLVPGMGDDVQAFKAGIMEIGDIFVLNKADHPHVERAEKELQAALSLAVRSDGWSPLTVRTVATQGEGIQNLVGHIETFERYRQTARESVERRKASAERELMELLKDALLEKATRQNGVCDRIHAASQAIKERRLDPYTAVDEIMKGLPSIERLMTLDHVGIAVHSIEEALRTYQQRLGFTVHEIVVIDEQKVRVAVLPGGDSRIELLEPTAPDSPIQRFLEKRGEGVHHLCFQVEDIRRKIEALKSASLQLIAMSSETGLDGRKIAFLHPKSTHGVLIELVECEPKT